MSQKGTTPPYGNKLLVYTDFALIVSTHPLLVSTHTPIYSTQVKSSELSGKRQGERERGICIQRSRAAPPRGEEGEEEEELEIAGVLVQKEIQPSL
ncbi:hypothetical protein Taro_046935 [Colocasia esculenta]|uniref:Uncharacterized protein n=1 Tax=Colocasia esculenta TaxID=4460 RepID=A0A843WZV2_COLES|nr:hypothetical protein [Colocasia esculenta]